MGLNLLQDKWGTIVFFLFSIELVELGEFN